MYTSLMSHHSREASRRGHHVVSQTARLEAPRTPCRPSLPLKFTKHNFQKTSAPRAHYHFLLLHLSPIWFHLPRGLLPPPAQQLWTRQSQSVAPALSTFSPPSVHPSSKILDSPSQDRGLLAGLWFSVFGFIYFHTPSFPPSHHPLNLSTLSGPVGPRAICLHFSELFTHSLFSQHLYFLNHLPHFIFHFQDFLTPFEQAKKKRGQNRWQQFHKRERERGEE